MKRKQTKPLKLLQQDQDVFTDDPRKTLPSVPAGEPGAPHPKPPFPLIRAGGWQDELRMTVPHFVVELDYGAFLWLWQLVENKALQAERMVSTGKWTTDFHEAYTYTNYRARDSFRDAASTNFHAKAVMKEALDPEAPLDDMLKGPGMVEQPSTVTTVEVFADGTAVIGGAVVPRAAKKPQRKKRRRKGSTARGGASATAAR